MTTLKEKSEQLSLKIFRCPHCGGVLGNTTPNILYLGAVKLMRTITMMCGFCEKTVYWRPAAEKTSKV